MILDFDTDDLDALARQWADTEPQVLREMPRIMRKAGMNIKGEWSGDVSGSRHFGQIAPTINFDERTHFGAVHEVEVGPDRRRRAARLAGIGTFGGANGGGGTLPNPDKYLASEGPRTADAISDLIDRVLS